MTTALTVAIGAALLYALIKKKEGLFVILCVLVGVIWVPHDFWYKLDYSIYYGPNISGNVKIAKYPIDCDFLTSPIGAKGCHYEPVVTQVIQKSRAQRAGRWYPIVTYDQGKTWQWDDVQHPTLPLVNVIWQREEGAKPVHWGIADPDPLLTIIGVVAALGGIISMLSWYAETVPTPPPAGQQLTIWWRLTKRSTKPPRSPRPPRPKGAGFWEHVRWLAVWDQPNLSLRSIKLRMTFVLVVAILAWGVYPLWLLGWL